MPSPLPFARGFALLFAAAALAACGDAATAPRAADGFEAALAARGLPPELAVDRGDVFVVDGDIIVHKADLIAQPLPPAGPRKQYQTTTTATPAEYPINLSNLAGNAAWLAAARGAIAAWNAVPGSSMRLVETTGTAKITVRFGTCSGGTGSTIACADFPSRYTSCWPSGCYDPGPYVTIHTGFTGSLTADGQRIALTHELGHTMGLRHTDWNNRWCSTGPCSEGTGTYGAVQIPGTPSSTTGGSSSDPYSVMNAILNTSATSFSYYDRVAIRYLFPYGPGPDNTAELENGNARVSWSPVGDAASYDVYFVQVEACNIFCYGPAPSTTTYVGTTTSTSFLDTSRSFTNIDCYFYAANAGYQVRVNFTDGKQTNLGGFSTHNGAATCLS